MDLSKPRREYLIKILTESLTEEREDDGSRFSVLYKAATDVCGNGILTSSRKFDLVLGRRMISYKMREEGYSFPTIGKHLIRDHSSIHWLDKKMREAFEIGYDYDLAMWELFNQKIKQYENESKAV